MFDFHGLSEELPRLYRCSVSEGSVEGGNYESAHPFEHTADLVGRYSMIDEIDESNALERIEHGVGYILFCRAF